MNALVEILIFAAISFYLFFRLWNLLGTKTGSEKGPRDIYRRDSEEQTAANNIIPLPLRPPSITIEEETMKKGLETDLASLLKHDPSFSPERFIIGAKKAFQMIIKAFSKNDKETLERLLNENVLKQFLLAIQERFQKGHTIETEVLQIHEAKIQAIPIKEPVIQLIVQYVSEQIVVTKNKEGQIIDNPAKIPIKLTDIWTFERCMDDQKSNWKLVATKSD